MNSKFAVIDESGHFWEEVDVNGVKCLVQCVGAVKTYTLNEAERIAFSRCGRNLSVVSV